MARIKFSLIIPVRNGGELFLSSIKSVLGQTVPPSEIIIFDTESTDDAIGRAKALLKKIPTRIFHIGVSQFDHGGTRNAALEIARYPWALFLTQDAVLADAFAFENLLNAAGRKKVVAVYGRQLPHEDANPLAITARAFNYGEAVVEQSMATAGLLGIKAWFVSNSFCLWNRVALRKAGGFAEKLILGEDMHAAARLIQAGGLIIYEPTARVRHSHNYSALEEFRRYFDIGVFHAAHADLIFRAGNPGKEGFKFVLAQARQLWKIRAFAYLLRLPFHVIAKLLGYKLGRKFRMLGPRISRAFSMHKNYWIQS